MQRTSLAFLDLVVAGLIGAAAGEQWVSWFCSAQDSPISMHGGTALGAAAAVSLVRAILLLGGALGLGGPSPSCSPQPDAGGQAEACPGRSGWPLILHLPSMVLGAAAGSLLGVCVVDFLRIPDASHPRLRLFSAALFCGFLFTVVLVRALRRAGQSEPAWGDLRTILDGSLLPGVALLLVHLMWGFSCFSLACMASLGAVWGGLAGGSPGDAVSAPAGDAGSDRWRRMVSPGLLCGVLLLAGRFGPETIEALPSLAWITVLAVLAAVASTVAGAVLAGASSDAGQPAQMAAGWFHPPVGETVAILLFAGAGAFVGGFLTSGFGLEGDTRASLLVWALSALGVGSVLLRRVSGPGRWCPSSRIAEGGAVASGFLLGSIPAGAMFILAGSWIARGGERVELVNAGLGYGLIAGGCVVVWEVRRLYRPKSISDWAPWLWAWGIAGFLVWNYREDLARVLLEFAPILRPPLVVVGAALALVAVWEFGHMGPARGAEGTGVPVKPVGHHS